MEKIIEICGRPVKFRCTAAFTLRYKAQFNRDAMIDLYKMQDAVETEKSFIQNEDGQEQCIEKNSIKDFSNINLELFYNIIWMLAKTADQTIPNPLEWFDEFDEFPIAEVLPELMEMITQSMTPTISRKKK